MRLRGHAGIVSMGVTGINETADGSKLQSHSTDIGHFARQAPETHYSTSFDILRHIDKLL